MHPEYPWPYPNELGALYTEVSDVLVLGGGMAGCFAAIAAAQRGQKVTLLEKGAVEKSGSAGTGFDHWENACTNPCSGVTAEEIASAFFTEQDGFSNGIANYIGCREGYDRLLDVERFGGKIRDTEDEFAGAEFRDEKTKFLFAYDYKNRFTFRVWGSTFKSALLKEMRRLGVAVCDRTEATALLIAKTERGITGAGAVGMDVHTGRVTAYRAKATVLCMSRPARVWLFDADQTGLCEFRPMQSVGSGHAMGWRAGMEFTMMEKCVRAEFSASGRSFPPYGTGNNHNTWYAATMVDAAGREIPYVDRDGRELTSVSARYYPAPGQKFFLKGGVIDEAKYAFRGPETLPFDELMRRGYVLPFYADLSRMPEMERKAIWGLMVGEEGKTKIPIYDNYTRRGFDPSRHMLQSYGTGWQSAAFLDQERQFFGAPGGILHDWNLMTNLPGVFAAGDQLFASDCAGFACSTGYYAGRKAAVWANAHPDLPSLDEGFLRREQQRLLAPLSVSEENGIHWKELNKAIAKAMQNYCGGVKCDALLREGLDLLETYEYRWVPRLSASNPHDLMRIHEVLDILTVAQMVLYASLARKNSSVSLSFVRSDDAADAEGERCHIAIRRENGQVLTRKVPLDYFGDMKTEYEAHNADYIPGAAVEMLADRSVRSSEKLVGTLPEIQIPDLIPIPCSAKPLHFDASLCIGCNRCASVCQCDVLLPSPKKGEHPVVMYPGECYYCGACVMVCPRKGAITLEHPLMNQAKFVPVKK